MQFFCRGQGQARCRGERRVPRRARGLPIHAGRGSERAGGAGVFFFPLPSAPGRACCPRPAREGSARSRGRERRGLLRVWLGSRSGFPPRARCCSGRGGGESGCLHPVGCVAQGRRARDLRSCRNRWPLLEAWDWVQLPPAEAPGRHGAGGRARWSTTLDQFGAPAASVSMNSKTITNVGNPVNATDAANKQYVDSSALGLDVKGSVKVATRSLPGRCTTFSRARGAGPAPVQDVRFEGGPGAARRLPAGAGNCLSSLSGRKKQGNPGRGRSRGIPAPLPVRGGQDDALSAPGRGDEDHSGGRARAQGAAPGRGGNAC